MAHIYGQAGYSYYIAVPSSSNQLRSRDQPDPNAPAFSGDASSKSPRQLSQLKECGTQKIITVVSPQESCYILPYFPVSVLSVMTSDTVSYKKIGYHRIGLCFNGLQIS